MLNGERRRRKLRQATMSRRHLHSLTATSVMSDAAPAMSDAPTKACSRVDAGGTQHDLNKKHALVSEAKALEMQIADKATDWQITIACLIDLDDDAVNFEYEIAQAAIKYITLLNMRNKLAAKKDEILDLIRKTTTISSSSTDEQIGRVIVDEQIGTDSHKKEVEQISLDDLVKNLTVWVMIARKGMSTQDGRQQLNEIMMRMKLD